MFKKRQLFILAITSVLLLALGTSPGLAITTLIQPKAESGDSPGMTFPYGGQLTRDDGNPVVDGMYDFYFDIYDAAEEGNLLWSEMQTDVRVSGGKFSVTLGMVNPFPEMDKEATFWLQVNVHGPKDQDFIALAPRQRLSSRTIEASYAPSTDAACPHDHLGESWPGAFNSYALEIDNSGSGDGIRSYSHTTTLNNAALFGFNTGAGTAVYGYSTAGNGVYAKSSTNDGVNATTDASGMSAVYGHAANSFGVTGESSDNFGVLARGKDSGGSDNYGDLFLDGGYGEIFATKSSYSVLDLFSNHHVMIDLDNNNDDANSCLYILNGADISVGKTCEDGTKSAILQTMDYGQRAVYTIESPEVWLEDFGSASLVSGAATVTLSPIFAEMVNTNVEYHVFVTPLCQAPVVLFITSKTSTGFTVQGVSLDGKPSDCSFDYRITAKRIGLEELRLELVPRGKPILQEGQP